MLPETALNESQILAICRPLDVTEKHSIAEDGVFCKKKHTLGIYSVFQLNW